MTMRGAPLNVLGLSAIAVVNLWLFVVVVTALFSDGLPAADKVDWKFGRSESTAATGGRKPVDAYTQVLAKPVFFKSRAPFVPAPAQPVQPPTVAAAPVDPGFVLGGVMIKNGTRKAYVYSRTSPEGAWLAEREKFMGWEIRLIGKTNAKLEQQGRSIELHLYPQ